MKRSPVYVLMVTTMVLAIVSGCAAPVPTPAPAAAPLPAAPAAQPAAPAAPAAAPAPTSVPAAAPAAPAAPSAPAAAPAATTAPAPAAGQPKMGGTITFGMKEDVTSLDPLKAIQYGDIRLNILVAQQLVAPDRQGNFVGVLAEKWETSADGKTWTFTLRKGVKFHNGKDVTADDVKWIFDRIMDEKAGAAMRATYAGIKMQTQVVDAGTVKFTIEGGSGPFLNYLALLNRSAIIHRDSYNADGSIKTIIGTGPFMIDAIKPGDSYSLKKFPDYWKKGQPYLDGVVLKVITDPSARLNAIRTGDVTMTEELPIQDVKKLQDKPDPNFTAKVYYINSGERLVMNTQRAPFNNKNARLAFEYIFDRDQYNDAIFFGLGQVHNQPFEKSNVWYLDVPIIKPDLNKAKDFFKASGLPQGTKITMLLMPTQKDRTEVIQAMLGQVGFQVTFDTVDTAAWNNKGKAMDYDLLMGTMTGIFDPDRPYGYLQKSNGSNWLVGGYDTPKMNELLDLGRSLTDLAKRKDVYKQVVQLVQDDAATLYVLGLPWVDAWRSNVKGYQPGTSPALMMMDASDGLNVTWLDK
jgi:peptide/nickel transport system substrate-binding protein